MGDTCLGTEVSSIYSPPELFELGNATELTPGSIPARTEPSSQGLVYGYNLITC